MQQCGISLSFFLVISFATINSSAQHKVIKESQHFDIYVGSTPCDSFIRAQIGIPANVKCDFIKWQLSIDVSGSDSFEIKATYGESKPNTLGFIKATEFQAIGKYQFSTGSKDNHKAYILKLSPPEFKTPVILIAMDQNILHFADQNNRLLVGNGGWGYVLNSQKFP
jgi:hypothetical protein